MKANKRGQVSLGNAPAAVLALIVLAITLVIGAFVMGGLQDQTSAPVRGITNSTAENASGRIYILANQSLSGLLSFSGFQNVIAVIIAAVIILSLIAFFRFRG